MDKTRYLLLEDGTVFKGKAFGAEGDVTGEVVFTTAMTGYLETLTDSSNYGQIIVHTFPLIGNYGIVRENLERDRSFVKGYIVRDWCQEPSNFRAQGDLDTFLREMKVPGLYGIDTRALTKIIRNSGVMKGMIISELPADTSALIAEMKEYAVTDALAAAATGETLELKAEGEAVCSITVLDLGSKKDNHIQLQQRGCDVKVVPYDTPAADILAAKPDGVLITNGPGNPAENAELIAEIGKLRESGVPVFGIGLGHEIMAVSAGAKTEKLKYGHRGGQPAKILGSDRVIITSQNHGYHVLTESLPECAELTYANVNDGTCEGLRYTDHPAASVQFIPETQTGHIGLNTVFDEFIETVKEVGVNAIK